MAGIRVVYDCNISFVLNITQRDESESKSIIIVTYSVCEVTFVRKDSLS